MVVRVYGGGDHSADELPEDELPKSFEEEEFDAA